MVNKKRLIKLTQELIRINSENPPGNEVKIASFVKKYLQGLGLQARTYAFRKGRPNLVAVLKGHHARRTLLLTPHLDTVPVGLSWSFAPFSGTISRGRIYGLGATDCKGNLAVGLEAINSLVENKTVLDYNLIFAATADEESGSELGLIPLLDKGIIKADAAVVLDCDGFSIVVAQKGLIHLKIKIKGKKAHGAYPWRGINAIDIAIEIIRALKEQKLAYKKNKYLKAPTMNVGTIRGGDKVNVVADWCECELDFRFLPGTRANKLLKHIRGVVARHSRKYQIEIEGIQRPYEIEAKHPLVQYLSLAMRKAGARPLIEGSEGATVITFFQDKNIPAVATGFGSSGCAHIADEYVEIDNLYRGARALEEFLKMYRFNQGA
ncbi:M20 family peptidase [bacterium]|nr:MAG: M20 family peptidase [bacterium]